MEVLYGPDGKQTTLAEQTAKQFASGSPVLVMAMQGISQRSNINHRCPLSGNMEVTDMIVQDFMAPGYLLPAGQYRLDLDIVNTLSKLSIMNIQMFIKISSTATTLDMAMG